LTVPATRWISIRRPDTSSATQRPRRSGAANTGRVGSRKCEPRNTQRGKAATKAAANERHEQRSINHRDAMTTEIFPVHLCAHRVSVVLLRTQNLRGAPCWRRQLTKVLHFLSEFS